MAGQLKTCGMHFFLKVCASSSGGSQHAVDGQNNRTLFIIHPPPAPKFQYRFRAWMAG